LTERVTLLVLTAGCATLRSEKTQPTGGKEKSDRDTALPTNKKAYLFSGHALIN
jgi:hypothetical protein